MPINLFNDPLASIKLGADDILKGYIGNGQIFPNVITEFTSISGLAIHILPTSELVIQLICIQLLLYYIWYYWSKIAASQFCIVQLTISLYLSTACDNTQNLHDYN